MTQSGTTPSTYTATKTREAQSVAGTATRESATATQVATTTGTQTSTSTYSSTYTAPSSQDIDGDGITGYPADPDDIGTFTKYDNVQVNTDVVVVEVPGGVPAVEEYDVYETIVESYQEQEVYSVPASVEVEIEQTAVVTSTATRLKSD
jgi:hypothetical protein